MTCIYNMNLHDEFPPGSVSKTATKLANPWQDRARATFNSTPFALHQLQVAVRTAAYVMRLKAANVELVKLDLQLDFRFYFGNFCVSCTNHSS